jgi:hypothetical protein
MLRAVPGRKHARTLKRARRRAHADARTLTRTRTEDVGEYASGGIVPKRDGQARQEPQ